MGLCALVLGMNSPAKAASLITNGDFEDGGGSLTGWTVANQASGSGSTYLQSGTGSPLNGFSVPAAPGPTHAAMTDQSGPGSHVLYQDFVVPAAVSAATLSFEEFVHNYAIAYYTPATLDYSVRPNEQARVDLMTSTPGNEFSVAGGDVLLNLFQTNVGDPLVSGYNPVSTDVTALLQAHEGETLRLRFAEVDNQNFFNFGVDQVSLDVASEAAAPAPSTALGGVLLLGVVGGIKLLRKKGTTEPTVA
jgi:hypothetical protein